MLSEKCMHLYRKQYPEDRCSFLEPSPLLRIRNADGEGRVSPYEETDELFIDRLERSKKAGRNLFFEEWTEDYKCRPGINY